LTAALRLDSVLAVATAATDAIGLAFTHTKHYLIDRFRWGQWVRLALVGLVAGEMGSGGSNFSVPPNLPQWHAHHLQSAHGVGSLPVLLVACLVAVAIVLGVVFLYISSRMRFVLFDSIVASECRVRRYWARRAEPAFQYFLWQLVFALGALCALAIVVAPALILAVAAGWLEGPGAHLLPLVLGGVCLGLLVLVLIVVLAVIHVFTKDFVVPQMALEGLTPIEGWRRLWQLMAAEKAGFAVYAVLKIVLSIAAAVVGGIIAFVVALILLIPVGGVGFIAILGGAAIGLTWTPLTVAIVVAAAVLVVLLLISFLALLSVPFIVFFPAYSYYFFAGRYPPVSQALGLANSPLA
jgi:hypothetical protein